MAHSKDKGKRGERMWRDELRAKGFEATRTGWHQAAMGHEAKDVTCDELPVHWEVKNCEAMNLKSWLEQVKRDAKKGEIPVIAWKKNGRPWLIMLDGRHFLTIMQHCDTQALEETLQIKKNPKLLPQVTNT